MEVNFRQAAIAAKAQRHLLALALNIWGDREVTWTDGKLTSEKRLAAQLKVQFTPTLVFLDERGGVALRLNDYLLPPLAVLFEKPHCAQCDELHAVAFRRQEVLDQLAKFDVARFSFSGTEPLTSPEGKRTDAAAWARALNVGYVPTMLLFDARGGEIFRTEAYLRPFHIAGALEYVASGAYLSEPSFQRFLQTKAERMRSRGEPVDLWN